MAVTASFAFTITMFNVYSGQIYDVKADYSHSIDKIEDKVNQSNEKIIQISEDVAFIKGKIEKIGN